MAGKTVGQKGEIQPQQLIKKIELLCITAGLDCDGDSVAQPLGRFTRATLHKEPYWQQPDTELSTGFVNAPIKDEKS